MSDDTRRCERFPERWGRWAAWRSRWHALLCPECRRWRAADRGIDRLFRALAEEPVPEEGEARLLAALGLPPLALRPSPFALRLSTLRSWTRRPVTRRALAFAAPLALLLALFLVFTPPSPAQSLQATLSAMARVKTAHCVGTYKDYGSIDRYGRPLPGQMRVEWWYKAPDKYRKHLGPEIRGWSALPGSLIVNGRRVVFIRERSDGSRRTILLAWSLVTRGLSPFDFFSREGIVGRAARERGSRVTQETGVYGGRDVIIFKLRSTRQYPRGQTRANWTLYVDPSTDRIVRSELVFESRRGNSWRLTDTEILEQFEYDLPVDDALFKLPSAIEPPGPPVRRALEREAREKGDRLDDAKKPATGTVAP